MYGLYAPNKADFVAHVTRQSIDDEELDIRLARLTEDERPEFMRLCAKMEGRWVEPPAESIDSTAVAQIEPPKNTNGNGESIG